MYDIRNFIVSYEELVRKFNNTGIIELWSSIIDEYEQSPIYGYIDFDDMWYENLSQKPLELSMLYMFKGMLVHKRDMAQVGSLFLNKAQTDWQPRHLSSQHGINILCKGDKIPNTDLICPDGFHMFLGFEKISPSYSAIKRKETLLASTFEELKSMYAHCCASCGSKEGEVGRRDGKITKLQKGHCDPNKPLTMENTIPLCGYDNQISKDNFIFGKNGAIIKVNGAKYKEIINE